MFDYDKYKTKLEYPNKAEYTTVFAYKGGEVVWQGPLEKWRTLKPSPSHAALERVVDTDALYEARTAYRNDQALLTKQFKADLFDEHGVASLPRAEDAYQLAYERGHSGGFEEVAAEFSELVTLIKPIV